MNIVETNIRLLDTAKHIIEKYQGMAEGNKLLPVPCYANCRHGIKAVAKLCGINKNVCWHQSRHSYATTICLSNEVPIEMLSKLMGHTSIRSTQIYAKITAEKVSNDIENLSKQIESMESLICNAILTTSKNENRMKAERNIIKMDEYGRIPPPSKKLQFCICHRPVGLLTGWLYGRHTCKLYSLIAHKLDKPPYCLPMVVPNYKPRI